jgi:O-acetylserine/cysteine efflux transporter
VVVLATFVGFGTWYWLLAHHASSVVAPFALLVPVTGLSSAWVLLGERPTALQLLGSLVAIVGVALVAVTRPPRLRPATRAQGAGARS